MRMRDVKTRKAVLDAVEEFDRIGRDAFLEKYGYGRARAYFLDFNGRLYDSKAIVGVAHGYEFPAEGPLERHEFSGGEATVQRKLEQLGFQVRVLYQPTDVDLHETDIPIVLVENEATVGSRYDYWQDVTGERYHFPNQYRNRVVPGRPFIYYRGSRRSGGERGQPEYFGFGTIGEVWRDPSVSPTAPRKDLRWFCEIEDYHPFSQPVPAKLDGEHIEQISPNQWGVAVRVLSQEAFERILELANVPRGGVQTTDIEEPIMPSIAEVAPSLVPDGSTLLVQRKSPDMSFGASGGYHRRSRYSKLIGTRAEEIVVCFLKNHLAMPQRSTVRWVAREGQTPGWDIEYLDDQGQCIAVEVKGTGGSRFPSIELTANEWQAAKELRGRYWLYLVVNCLTRNPSIESIQDPVGLEEAGRLTVMPTGWRLELSP